jgi:hypothetical protein
MLAILMAMNWGSTNLRRKVVWLEGWCLLDTIN